MRTICLAILNYKGLEHLKFMLPSVLDVPEVRHGQCRVVVLDNQSPAEDEQWVKTNYPTIEFVKAPKNDYLFSYNWFCSQIEEDIVIFLNNDMRVESGFLGPLLQHFEGNDVFAVSSLLMNWDGKGYQTGPMKAYLHHGWFYSMPDIGYPNATTTLFCGGGCSAIQRDKFLALGGFDRLFFPAYGEDLDLCWRAWARGWRCLYEPASRIYHRESGTMKDSARFHILRSGFLFQWKNLNMRTWRIKRALYCQWKQVTGQTDSTWENAYQAAKKEWAERKTLVETMAKLPPIIGGNMNYFGKEISKKNHE
jgi:GT2 family glycosyltransferase